jgi:hypothetical protein
MSDAGGIDEMLDGLTIIHDRVGSLLLVNGWYGPPVLKGKTPQVLAP